MYGTLPECERITCSSKWWTGWYRNNYLNINNGPRRYRQYTKSMTFCSLPQTPPGSKQELPVSRRQPCLRDPRAHRPEWTQVRVPISAWTKHHRHPLKRTAQIVEHGRSLYVTHTHLREPRYPKGLQILRGMTPQPRDAMYNTPRLGHGIHTNQHIIPLRQAFQGLPRTSREQSLSLLRSMYAADESPASDVHKQLSIDESMHRLRKR